MKNGIKEVEIMKRQIRREVFETNSSSVHSITMCTKSDYDEWQSGNLFLFDGYSSNYSDDNRPKRKHFYTKEEAIEFEKSNRFLDSDFDWDDDEKVMQLLRDQEWYSLEYYNYDNYYYFEESFTTPNGEDIVAFGYYGHDY
jgi:hypothetical protein